ncbi:MAG TPA: TetR/AcrR family transcriptional regulator [Usitatibacter sp.]|nr:TetR/AcrR family transcriptional regulator [Usitatibacter sp.]
MKRNRLEIPPPRGRPRSGEAHAAILAAAVALVREVGYDALTMEAVAARAGTGKATLYRRWKSREALVSEAVGLIVARIPVPSTGSTRRDLLAVMRDTVRLYADPATLGLLSGLVAAMARSPVIARAVRNGFVAAWSDTVRRVIENGIARGDLRRGIDIDLAIDLLGGCFSNRALVTGRPIDDRLARALVDAALRGFGAPA